MFQPSRFSRLLAACALSLFASQLRAADPPARLTLPFDANWKFSKGDPNHVPSAIFKDDTWRTLDLPHDWAIEGPFDEHAPTASAGASLPSGIAWYRKTFTVPPEAHGKKVFIELDGVMADSEVYINNALLGKRPNGYVELRYDLTNFLDPAGPNILAVRTDTSRQPASRAYSGAGIYRHTRLVIENPVHIQHQSTVVTTTRLLTDSSGTSAVVVCKTTLTNDSDTPRTVRPIFHLTDPQGNPVYFVPLSESTIQPGKSADFEASLNVGKAQLWSPEAPALYRATVEVKDNADVLLDEESFPVGLRTAEFRPDTGFWLNGKNIKILGMCLHSDYGALGMAVPASAWEDRLRALKNLGANAIRTAHNPPSSEFLNLCDRLGLMVMDEAFDCWSVGKESADYHLYFPDWWQRDLTSMIRRDRNHASIILYSLGNEILDILPQNPDPLPDQFTGPKRSIAIAKSEFTPMRDLAHQLDPTRPVTLAILRPNVSGIYDNGFSDLMDVVGQNYRDNELAAAHVQNPLRKIIGTEDYKTPATWIALRDNPALAGQFIWAGADYLGEAGKWPNVVSPSGMLDRTNFPRGDALERESWWSTKPVLHVVRIVRTPTRPGRPDTLVGMSDWTPANTAAHTETVDVYSNLANVELFLNDQSLGTKTLNADASPREWSVPFAPGVLRAVAHTPNDLGAAQQDELRTAGAPAKIILTTNRTTLPNDFDDVVYIRAAVTDSAGITVPSAENLIHFTLTGPGTIAATDNASVKDHDPFQSPDRHATQGTCVAILRATANTGDITLTASSESLTPGSTKIAAAPPSP